MWFLDFFYFIVICFFYWVFFIVFGIVGVFVDFFWLNKVFVEERDMVNYGLRVRGLEECINLNLSVFFYFVFKLCGICGKYFEKLYLFYSCYNYINKSKIFSVWEILVYYKLILLF